MTTITSDPGILCFHHCNVKVFCFTLPHICPNCNTKLQDFAISSSENAIGNDNDNDNLDNRKSNSIENKTDINTDNQADNANANDDVDANVDVDADADAGVGVGAVTNNGDVVISKTKQFSIKLLPFRLPYPFVRATQYPCAIVLRPSAGDFLNDYNNATDLHIAVTTSNGDIVEFDRDGLQQHRHNDYLPDWWQCLLVGDAPEPWYDYWDHVLKQISGDSARWSIQKYDESKHNCYTFVLAFLQELGYDKLSAAAYSKTIFCEKYIIPKTITAGKYISLYRKLRDAGVHVQSQPENKTPIDNISDAIATTSHEHSIISRSHSHTLCTIEE